MIRCRWNTPIATLTTITSSLSPSSAASTTTTTATKFLLPFLIISILSTKTTQTAEAFLSTTTTTTTTTTATTTTTNRHNYQPPILYFSPRPSSVEYFPSLDDTNNNTKRASTDTILKMSITTNTETTFHTLNDIRRDDPAGRSDWDSNNADDVDAQSDCCTASARVLSRLLNVSDAFVQLRSSDDYPNVEHETCRLLKHFIDHFDSETLIADTSLNTSERHKRRKRSLDDNDVSTADTFTSDADAVTLRDDVDGDTTEVALARLCQLAESVSLIFCQLSSPSRNDKETEITTANKWSTATKISGKNRNRKQTWQRLQHAAQLLQYPVPSSDMRHDQRHNGAMTMNTASTDLPPHPSNVLAISLVFGSLALTSKESSNGTDDDVANGSKAAASALSSTVSRNKVLRHKGMTMATSILRTYLIHSSGLSHDNCNVIKSNESSFRRFDLQILNHFAKAFKLNGERSIESHITARAVESVVKDCVFNMESGGGGGGGGDDDDDVDVKERDANDSSRNTVSSLLVDDRLSYNKQRISGALALACQLQPWSLLSPMDLVEAAISFSLWHAAEEVCHSAYKSVSITSSSKNKKSENGEDDETLPIEQQKNNVELAVRCLIQAAMDDHTYRRADTFATNLYDAGGWSMYVEARYFHACETIAKVIKKRQIPIVDRQIERVDKAVAKVSSLVSTGGVDSGMINLVDNATYPKPVSCDRDNPSIQGPSFSPSDEIRRFALRKIEESGDIAAAKRLASIYGINYVYDERAIMLATAIRKRRYLQFEDVIDGDIPPLIDDPTSLREAFDAFVKESNCRGPFGFDAEWDEETVGAAILQLASMDQVLLIDMLAMKSSEAGIRVLRDTVGKLFGCNESVVAGFACRQDLSRLRATSGSNHSENWLSEGTAAIVDLQSIVGKTDRSLLKAGLSSFCQNLLGKPLDKSEQCSMWSERPLSESQREYAALDAWACVAIFNKLHAHPIN